MREEQFQHAFQFLAGYFHQDFGAEFGEPEAAVQKFIVDADVDTRVAVLRELRQIAAGFSDQQLDEVIFGLGCYYSPQRHRGIPMSQWLDSVMDQIQQSLDA